ncbi:MAG TPA: hypothetical protein VK891_03305, partial [Euzebyales bacterium]|nr:hypothetical protein [Euzebyales bacterium]
MWVNAQVPLRNQAEARGGAPWYLRLGAWIGIGTSPGALMAGAGMAAVAAPVATLVGVVAGVLLLSALAVANGVRGQRLGAPTVELARRVFGPRAGPRVVATLITMGVAGWSGVYFGVAGAALAALFGMPVWLACVPVAATVWLVYRGGFRRWNLLVGLTGVAAVAVAVFSYAAIRPGAAPPPVLVGGGVAQAGQVLLIAGLVVSFAAVFALRSPDFTWDARAPRDVWRAGAVLALTLLVFLLLGVGIYRQLGQWDLAQLVHRSTRPALGALLLTLSVLAPVVSGLHSGALGLSRVAGWHPHAGAAMVLTCALALGATQFHVRLLGFMAVIGAVLAPVLPVLLLAGSRYRSRHGWAAWL